VSTNDVYAAGYVSATMKGIWNHMRALDVLTMLPEVDSERFAVIGHSLGGHNALFLAAFDTRIKAVVSSCGFNSFFAYNGGDLTGWSTRVTCRGSRANLGRKPVSCRSTLPKFSLRSLPGQHSSALP
jgi:predicted dienelactone hydrolase